MELEDRASAVITLERPDTTEAILLITELEAHLDPLYPRESQHGLSVEQLLAQDVAFFVLRWNGTAAACGGLKLADADYGEVKRMYVRPHFRGLGLSKLMVQRLADYALARSISVLRLETGIYQHEAIGLYERMGFRRIPPFGEYTDDPLSLYYEKRLA